MGAHRELDVGAPGFLRRAKCSEVNVTAIHRGSRGERAIALIESDAPVSRRIARTELPIEHVLGVRRCAQVLSAAIETVSVAMVDFGGLRHSPVLPEKQVQLLAWDCPGGCIEAATASCLRGEPIPSADGSGIDRIDGGEKTLGQRDQHGRRIGWMRNRRSRLDLRRLHPPVERLQGPLPADLLVMAAAVPGAAGDVLTPREAARTARRNALNQRHKGLSGSPLLIVGSAKPESPDLSVATIKCARHERILALKTTNAATNSGDFQ